MNGIFVMLVFFSPSMAAAGVEKIGVYETREQCVQAAEEAGFLPIIKGDAHGYEYACVFSPDPYIME